MHLAIIPQERVNEAGEIHNGGGHQGASGKIKAEEGNMVESYKFMKGIGRWMRRVA